MLRRGRQVNIQTQDAVVVYPTVGHRVDGGRYWRVPLRVDVYGLGTASRRKQLLLRLLQRVAKVQPSQAQQSLFDSRLRAFIAPTERGKRVHLQVGEHVHCLRKRTRRNGSLETYLRLDARDFPPDQQLDAHVLTTDGQPLTFPGAIRLLPETGLSVISDIDDTIKVTNVHSRRELLENTFLREFESVAGMAPLYRDWSAAGAAFHYVSSSPWQLYEPLAGFRHEYEFPAGSFHLRSFRLRDHMLRRLLLIRRKGKVNAIKSLLRLFPLRQFILVGDSGERDPEIYARLARKQAGQVRAICIRDLPQRPLTPERLDRLRSQMDLTSWHAFRDPAELPPLPLIR